jgi:hypothetical protein
VATTVSGWVITRTGKWKAWLLTGGALLTAGLGLLGSIRSDTPFWRIDVFMALMGLGVGMTLQNLVPCTQNQVVPSDLGAASSTVNFFRSLGGAVGVAVLGSVLTDRIGHYTRASIGSLVPQSRRVAGEAVSSGALPGARMLPAPVRTWLPFIAGLLDGADAG